MKMIVKILAIVILVGLSNFSYAQSVGDTAPDFTLQTLGGQQFTLSDHQGKVVFIFFFGYACPHCLANGPNTQELYNEYKNNAEFVAVGVDTWDGNSSGVSSFKTSTDVEYTLCLKGSEVEKNYQTTYDRIVIVDKDGIIRFKATSDATQTVVDQASDVIDTYLAKEPSGDDPMDDDDMMKGGTVTALNETDSYQSATSVFPNPAKNVLNLETESFNGENFEVAIFNTSGKKAFEQKYVNRSEETVSLPTEQLADGLYILKISSSDRTVIKKFLVLK